MSKTENLLTARQVQAALRKGDLTQLNDGGGLYLKIDGKNRGTWIVRGRLNGVQKRRVLGHEDLSLADARDFRDKERKALQSGTDTIAEKKAVLKKSEEEGRTFGMIADEWLVFWKHDKDDKTIQSTVARLNRHILPFIGKHVYRSLEFSDLKSICIIISEKGHREMANRVATIINQICRFAKINGYHQYNIAEDLTALFPKPKREATFEGLPAITDKNGVTEMLRRIVKFIENGRCSPYTAAALQLFPLIPLRAASMLSAEWKDVSFDEAIWRIPAENMKGEVGKRRDFIVPLSRQALEILQNLYEYRLNKYLFPSGGKSGHIGIEGVNNSMHRAGIPKGKMCIHGWRKVWGSLAREYGLPDKIVERGLAHVSGNAVEQAYNKAEYRELMRYAFQWWADVLDALRDGKEIPQLILNNGLLFS